MALPDREPAISTTFRGATHGFCSERCRGLFLEFPDRYLASMHASEGVSLH
jgi:YHS domain-containing protein